MDPHSDEHTEGTPAERLPALGGAVEDGAASASLSVPLSVSVPAARTFSPKKSTVVHRPRSLDHVADSGGGGGGERANREAQDSPHSPPSSSSSSSSAWRQRGRLRNILLSLPDVLKGRVPLSHVLRRTAHAIRDAVRPAKEFVDKLPHGARLSLLVLLGLCKVLLLILLFRGNCNCKEGSYTDGVDEEMRSLAEAASLSLPDPKGKETTADLLKRGVDDVDLAAYDHLAVCLSGDPKYLPFTGPTLVRHVIEPFAGPHVFVSAHMNEHAHRISVFAELVPKRSWELSAVRLWSAPGGAGVQEVWSSFQPSVRVLPETLSMVNRWFLVEDSFHLVLEHERRYSIKYKWVVQASLDQFWAAPVPGASFDLEHEVAVPFTAIQGGLNEYASVSQRRAAGRFMPRLGGLIRTLTSQSSSGVYQSLGVGSSSRPASVLLRMGLALNMMQHIGFVSLPFCRLTSSSPSAVLAVGSIGAVDGYPCHPCTEIVRGQQGWALATKGVPEESSVGPIPLLLPHQMNQIGVCYGKLPPLGPDLYPDWNRALRSGKLLQEADAGKVGLSSGAGSVELPRIVTSGATSELADAARQWQKEPGSYGDCMARSKMLQEKGILGSIGGLGLASPQGGATAESICTRWLMGPMEGMGSHDWPVFTLMLNKDSIVYQLGVGNNIAFVKAITRSFLCQIYGFDASPRSINWMRTQRMPMKFHNIPYMLAPKDGPLLYIEEKDGTPTFFGAASKAGAVSGSKLPGKSMKTIMAQLKHSKVDVALIDMRGADSEILLSWASGSTSPKICQLLVRHYETSPSMRFKDELPLQHLSTLGFVLAYNAPVSRGFLSLFYHPQTCVGSQRLA